MNIYGYIGIVEADSIYEINRNTPHRQKQKEQLTSVCNKLVLEKTFRIKAAMRIDKLITELKQGDTIVICNLKFLASGIDRLLERIQAMEKKGIILEVLNIKQNSLGAHAQAIREFNKYVSGSKISKGMKGQNDKKKGNLNVKHTRAIIKDWHKQRRIALDRNTGRKTVLELSKMHEVTRQVIYRIINKDEFKGITESLPWRFESWDLEECKKRVRLQITRKDNLSIVRVYLNNFLNVKTYEAKKNISYSNAEAYFLAKPDDELEEIFNQAKEKGKQNLEFFNN